jgi:glycosyltransferase involved in cell wall biosynthesis
MKIAIDISQIIYGTGVSMYTRNLVEALLKIDSTNEYVLFGGSMRRHGELENIAKSFKGNFTPKIFAYPATFADLVWNRLHKLPVEKLIGPVDVLHTSDWSEPPTSAFKVTTVHDLYPFKFPKLVHPRILDVHKRKMFWVLKESKAIIVPSESTKADVVSLGAKESIIRVIPEAPSQAKRTTKEVNEAKKKYGIRGDYVISVGATPLKNTKRIIEAFHLARSGRDLKLVLVGRPSNLKIEEQRNVRILGHVPSEDYGSLLTGASALIFASIYEGYGIPILDGFACGVPVVTSDTASMPEVAGDAAVLVDPYSKESISEGILKALKGPKGMIQKGLERVKDFSWDKTAAATLNVYKESISNSI